MKLITPAEAAARLGITTTALARLAARGIVPCYRISQRLTRYDEAAVEAHLDAARRSAAAAPAGTGLEG